MTYLTSIPSTKHADRERVFLAERTQARESVARLRVAHDALVEVSTAHFSRNYIDLNIIHKAVIQIAALSRTIRGLALAAMQPDPPRHTPINPTQDALEPRTYGGISAARLVWVLTFLRGLRLTRGVSTTQARVARLSDKLVHGLDIYTRVKALTAKLLSAVSAPKTALTPHPSVAKNTEPRPPKTRFKWETTPHQFYRWAQARARSGYDPRQTSLYWLERQATALTRSVYRAHHNITPARPTPRIGSMTPADNAIELRPFIPPMDAERTDDIWPPIDLVRMIEEHAPQIKPQQEPQQDDPRELEDVDFSEEIKASLDRFRQRRAILRNAPPPSILGSNRDSP